MNKLQVIFAICLFAFASSSLIASRIKHQGRRKWELFKHVHAKKYEGNDEYRRWRVFRENHYKISEHNKLYELGLKSYSMKMNEYGDLRHQEFDGMMNGFKLDVTRSKRPPRVFEGDNTNLPDRFDWRERNGTVTGVKNQGTCGSCWAFSATGSLEGQHFLKTGNLVSLSEQNLLDCSFQYGNLGCNGGVMDSSFDYIIANGIDTEESYPYHGIQQNCSYSPDNVGAYMANYTKIIQGSESDLQKAVAQVGPISVAIDASHQSFQFYDKGIYDPPNCSNSSLDHGVLVVGYGVDERGWNYWLVKNSWGVSWGMDGYLFMSRNKNNQCGIASSASYPIV